VSPAIQLVQLAVLQQTTAPAAPLPQTIYFYQVAVQVLMASACQHVQINITNIFRVACLVHRPA
jgi:hypothetical protein